MSGLVLEKPSISRRDNTIAFAHGDTMTRSPGLPAPELTSEARRREIARLEAEVPSAEVRLAMRRQLAAGMAAHLEEMSRIPWPPRR